MAMMRNAAARYVSRRMSSSGKILSEEEKAAENIYIKKLEKEKLEKLARKGPKPEEAAPSTGAGGSVTDAKPSGGSTSSTSGVSTDRSRNYAILGGVIAGIGALGWYLRSKDKKPKEIED